MEGIGGHGTEQLMEGQYIIKIIINNLSMTSQAWHSWNSWRLGHCSNKPGLCPGGFRASGHLYPSCQELDKQP